MVTEQAAAVGTPSFGLHYDFRAPDFGASPSDLYAAAVAQCAWADRHGFGRVAISSHHGCEDNYGPSPVVVGSAIAAVTTSMRIVPILALPLHHPLHVAEDVAVLDIVSGGRVDLMVAAGYVIEEFAMFGSSMERRGALMEEGVTALRAAWTGEPFEFRGEQVLVRPRPVQHPGPPIIMAGDSRSAARRAARLGDAYAPMAGGGSWDHYVEACAELGMPVPPARRAQRPMFVWVAEDPDAMWAKLGRHLLHVNNSYARWMERDGRAASYVVADDIDDLRRGTVFEILDPDVCAAKVREWGGLSIDPLCGGIDPELAWDCLHLVVDEVVPRVEATTTRERINPP